MSNLFDKLFIRFDKLENELQTLGTPRSFADLKPSGVSRKTNAAHLLEAIHNDFLAEPFREKDLLYAQQCWAANSYADQEMYHDLWTRYHSYFDRLGEAQHYTVLWLDWPAERRMGPRPEFDTLYFLFWLLNQHSLAIVEERPNGSLFASWILFRWYQLVRLERSWPAFALSTQLHNWASISYAAAVSEGWTHEWVREHARGILIEAEPYPNLATMLDGLCVFMRETVALIRAKVIPAHGFSKQEAAQHDKAFAEAERKGMQAWLEMHQLVLDAMTTLPKLYKTTAEWRERWDPGDDDKMQVVTGQLFFPPHFVNDFITTHARYRMLGAIASLAEYFTLHGRYPEDLGCFSTVQPDPFSNAPFGYKRTETGYKIASAGPNGKLDDPDDPNCDDLTFTAEPGSPPTAKTPEASGNNGPG